jgi:hypothetical protein
MDDNWLEVHRYLKTGELREPKEAPRMAAWITLTAWWTTLRVAHEDPAPPPWSSHPEDAGHKDPAEPPQPAGAKGRRCETRRDPP